MENFMFRNLSRMQVCRKMAMICQQSADETDPGVDHERLQDASDKFRAEADQLAIQDLQQALLPRERF
jgi:hypothetical protein